MKMLLPVLLMLATGKTILPGEVKVKTLPPESREVLDYLPRNIVIAHRGTTYWAPEETEAAMRWARNIGADYLELDLQRTISGSGRLACFGVYPGRAETTGCRFVV